jgi:putative DNA primase/helicase
MEKLLNPDFAQAKKFLDSLDPGSTLHTFQTFDDNADCKKTSLARTLNGTFEEHQDALVQLNNQGAGVFITVQRTDGTGRKKKNIVVIRSFFVEDDSGTGGIALPIEPQITVESSPGKYHRYLLCENVPIESFEGIQQRLVDDYGSDPCAKDRSRVLRLPGFYHQKVNAEKGLTGTPFMVRVVK